MPERFHYPLPEVFFLPSAVGSAHRQPRPELLFGPVPPRRSCAQNPHDPGEYLTTIASGPSRGRLLRGHKRRLSRVSRPFLTQVLLLVYKGMSFLWTVLCGLAFRLQNTAIFEWAMLGSNQRPLPCEGRSITPWSFATVQKYLQTGTFSPSMSRSCSPLFVWVGVLIGVVAVKLTLWRSSLGRPVAGPLRVRGGGEALLRVGRVVVGAVDVVVDARLVAFH